MSDAGPARVGARGPAEADAEVERTLQRWRLVLGPYADQRLPRLAAASTAERLDAALHALYGRELHGRGARGEGGAEEDGPRTGSLGGSAPTVVAWLDEVRQLFPQRTAEVVEADALQRYGLTELVTDPTTLERLEPSQELLETLLALRGHLSPDVLHLVRRVVEHVVEEVRQRLQSEVRRALTGRASRTSHTVLPSAATFDVHGTIRANLHRWDAENRRLPVERPLFFARNARRLPWDVVLCVDQSGSMASSVIHSAVMAGILAGLPSLRVRLVVFDTAVVDLSDRVEDPVEVLLSVQLGGGTDIAAAVTYCEGLVENPTRTVLVLVTDFCEGGPVGRLEAAVARLAEARVTMIGLAALDGRAEPAHDRTVAGRLAARGMRIAALTPDALARWLAEVVS
ncbi:VWA domain-containing protein [Aquipuribacter sp. SD81]|uniref:VWA domain-containing protein n=1 Tax=Aquipuribacter sp. SD81 TaxID=3127703 RepID=UPI0030165371